MARRSIGHRSGEGTGSRNARGGGTTSGVVRDRMPRGHLPGMHTTLGKDEPRAGSFFGRPTFVGQRCHAGPARKGTARLDARPLLSTDRKLSRAGGASPCRRSPRQQQPASLRRRHACGLSFGRSVRPSDRPRSRRAYVPGWILVFCRRSERTKPSHPGAACPHPRRGSSRHARRASHSPVIDVGPDSLRIEAPGGKRWPSVPADEEGQSSPVPTPLSPPRAEVNGLIGVARAWPRQPQAFGRQDKTCHSRGSTSSSRIDA
jgi:hypothetical protein